LTVTPPESNTPAPTEPTPPRKPLTPSPTALIIVLALLGLMAYNIHLDAASNSYNGTYLTGACAALIAGVLGFDLKFWRGDR
jgi:hypothetical protein